MLNLANQYARLKGTKILAHVEKNSTIIFVLASGPKLTMTEAQLRTEISKMEKTISKEVKKITPPSPKPKSKPKSKATTSKSKGKKNG